MPLAYRIRRTRSGGARYIRRQRRPFQTRRARTGNVFASWHNSLIIWNCSIFDQATGLSLELLGLWPSNRIIQGVGLVASIKIDKATILLWTTLSARKKHPAAGGGRRPEPI